MKIPQKRLGDYKLLWTIHTGMVTHADSIQFNSKTLLKDGDPVSSQLIFPGAIQTCDQTIQQVFIHVGPHFFSL